MRIQQRDDNEICFSYDFISSKIFFVLNLLPPIFVFYLFFFFCSLFFKNPMTLAISLKCVLSKKSVYSPHKTNENFLYVCGKLEEVELYFCLNTQKTFEGIEL